jgi:hypothetical protein
MMFGIGVEGKDSGLGLESLRILLDCLQKSKEGQERINQQLIERKSTSVSLT